MKSQIIPNHRYKTLTLKDIELLWAKFVKYPQMTVALSLLEFEGGYVGSNYWFLGPLQVRDLVPESQAYMDLLAFERKLDATIMRKRLDIQEALKRPMKVKYHTQPWMLGVKDYVVEVSRLLLMEISTILKWRDH